MKKILLYISTFLLFISCAKDLKKECSLPLMVTGGFRSLDFCNEALKQGELDIIGFGRPFLIQEDFPQGFLKKSNISFKKIK